MANIESFGYINGHYDNLDKLQVPVMDRGFIYGDGCYEVIPVYHKKPFLLEAHLIRWFQNLDKLEIVLKENMRDVTEILETLVTKSTNDFDYLYLQATRGSYPKREHIFPKACTPTIFAYVMPFAPPTFESLSQGIKVITTKDIRWQRCDIKSISLLGNVLLRQEAERQMAQEAILIRDDLVSEGSISNVFIVKSQTIKTPPLNNFILPGITRATVIDIARENGFKLIETEIKKNELFEADEIWLTSSTKEISPVKSIDNQLLKQSILQGLWPQVFKAYQEKK